MVRLILLVILVLFIVWILRPLFRTKDNNKNKDIIKGILSSSQNTFNTKSIIITSIILLALMVWILPKFGINLFALLQKIIPVISSLRGILPF